MREAYTLPTCPNCEKLKEAIIKFNTTHKIEDQITITPVEQPPEYAKEIADNAFPPEETKEGVEVPFLMFDDYIIKRKDWYGMDHPDELEAMLETLHNQQLKTKQKPEKWK